MNMFFRKNNARNKLFGREREEALSFGRERTL